MYYNNNTAAAGRELHHAINPGLAEFDRLLRKSKPNQPVSTDHGFDEREIFLSRARAIIQRTLKARG